MHGRSGPWRLPVVVLIVVWGLTAASDTVQANDAPLTLNPKSPIIDVPLETRRTPAPRRPKPARVGKKAAKPAVPTVREVVPTSAIQPTKSIEGVLREELPPLDAPQDLDTPRNDLYKRCLLYTSDAADE